MSDHKGEDALLVFTPSGKRGRFPLGTPILQAARSLGVDIDSVCGGRAICGRCQVELSEGTFAKHGLTSAPSHLSPLSATEQRYAEKRGLGAGRRLSCQARLMGDVVIDVPPESQVHKQVVRKRAEVRAIALDPATRLYYVEVAEPDMHNPSGDLERLCDALATQWGVSSLSCDLGVIQVLQKALRAGQWAVTVAIHHTERDANRIIAVWPGFHDQICGIAFDIGSTTIAAHLCNLSTGEVLASAGMMNPQIRFGEDLMSRVSYVMMNPGGDAEMTAAMRDAINLLIGQVCEEAAISRDTVMEAVLVGNPVMHHLLLGIDPVELGGAPFALATSGALNLRARELDLHMNPGGRLYILPCIAGHVGADSAAVVLSEGPHLQDENWLIVDVGTNAEIVLGNRQRLLACSSPTGPAFEGAQISSGQRAAPGAIERIRIDPATLEPRYKVIGCDLWSDEPGFAEAVEITGVTGICGSGIIEAVAEMFLAGIVSKDGVIDGALAARSPRIEPQGRTFSYLIKDGEPEIRITQNDIRQIQLAKAALYAGARLLMDTMGIDKVDRITLAGAFGSHIDVKHAMVLGMIPDCPLNRVSSAGNAAGTGARIALLNAGARREIETVVRSIEKVETAIEPRFQEHFVAAMAFPHKTAPYPNLAQVVALPEPKHVGGADEEREGRRRRRRAS
ncbi:ASKHA domain-containing protein [Rhodoligotrophos ferricapiens]|uniref:ASKHA domain-containing protein n=1 Tax=Rhodoligotrophos ferricapiens TaxID=3069264 RepID=UPI00315D1B32